MPTVLRQLNSFKKMSQQDKTKFLATWINELVSRLALVRQQAQHTIVVLKFNKQLDELKLKIDALARQSNRSISAVSDKERRLVEMYSALKGHEKTVFEMERDVLRPNSDGGKKAKLLEEVRKAVAEASLVFNNVTMAYRDAIDLYDQNGSDQGVMTSVNNGRTLLAKLRKYELEVTQYMTTLDSQNAKTISVKAEKEKLQAILSANKKLVEQAGVYVANEKAVARRLRGVTRKVAKQVGAIKQTYQPQIERAMSATKGGRSKLYKMLEDAIFSGGGSFPDPATIYLEKIRKLRVIPEVKELAAASVKLEVANISRVLTPATTLVTDVQENREHSLKVKSDVETVFNVLDKSLASSGIRQANAYSTSTLAALKKANALVLPQVHEAYLEDVMQYVQDYVR